MHAMKILPATVAVIALLVVRSVSVSAQGVPPDAQVPVFKVQIFGEVLADFTSRIDSYAALRNELERGLPPRVVTESAAEILQRTRALAERIRAARKNAKEGDIFTGTVGAEFRKALQAQADLLTCAALADDNPGKQSVRINGSYPEHDPLSTMPANVLASLPRLPEDVEYRFAGKHLILFDTRAGVLLDRLPSAIKCSGGR
jgi:hypothetical protein